MCNGIVDYPSLISAKRFIKNGKRLSSVKLSLSSPTEGELLISSGVVLSGVFAEAYKFVAVVKPLQCYKCFSFGHTSKFCSKDQICGNCAQSGHTFKTCDKIAKCSNCSGLHGATDLTCPIMLKKINNLNSDKSA